MYEVSSNLLGRARRALQMPDARADDVVQEAVRYYNSAGQPAVNVPDTGPSAEGVPRDQEFVRTMYDLRESLGGNNQVSKREAAETALAYVAQLGEQSNPRPSGLVPVPDPLGVVTYNDSVPAFDPVHAAVSAMSGGR